MNDTICALATAPGGALGIIRISGPQSHGILSRIFTKDLSKVKPNTIHYGHIVESDAVSQHQNIIDEVMVSVFRTPHSYTGEDAAEITCHGSRYILNKVLELLIKHGCRMAEPGEYTQRAYLNGKMDLSQAEAVADLIASTNKATHQIAMSQLRGHFSTELAQLREQLLKLTSLLELELDFSDHEDLEFADRSELLKLTKKIDNHITRLVESFETGQAIKQGIPVAIVGKTNVGKSTLLNRLLKEDRAIVSNIHGTTRDTIEDTIDIQGITFRFIDTAGIRHTDDRIERMGIDRSMAAAQRARIILMMTEPGIPYPDITVRDDQTVIRIENKTETFQAKYGVGLDELRQRLVDAAPKTNANNVIVTNARHYDALLRAHDSILRVIDGLQQQLSGDLLSEDLRQTLDTLAEITGGQITPQETLNNIFQHFCVGK
ncbi:MAG: tRNA uridine-5-carboxymethylaminomethyl(34) synthesis GTPase MnmE [Prevotella sp.]|jgi:tRNA modification GTPase|nr:tRNA uridine-5-carboxymethylaminomethyl(34) synthesis GTPase MnmE [Prevotella sp.]